MIFILILKVKKLYFFNLLFLQISLPQHPNPPSSGLGQAIQFGGAGLQQVVMNVGGQQVIVQQPQQHQQQQAQVLSVRTANGQVVQVKIEFQYLKLNVKINLEEIYRYKLINNFWLNYILKMEVG
jgi:hypothetical protein